MLILPISLAVVPVLFPGERARRKAVALVMGALVGLPFGPIADGEACSASTVLSTGPMLRMMSLTGTEDGAALALDRVSAAPPAD